MGRVPCPKMGIGSYFGGYGDVSHCCRVSYELGLLRLVFGGCAS